MKIISTAIPSLLPLDRKPGLHVSDIIYYICLCRGLYKESGTKNSTRLELGLALEWAIKERYRLDKQYGYVAIQYTKDGIHCSPDFVNLVNPGVEEFKLTWLSAAKGFDSESFWKFVIQLMAYCYGLEYRIGRLHVCHVNGDYKFGTPGAEPTCPVYEEEFSRKALNSNWEMLRNNAEDAWKFKQGLISIPK